MQRGPEGFQIGVLWDATVTVRPHHVGPTWLWHCSSTDGPTDD